MTRDYTRANGHIGRYEFEGGALVKIDGARPEYMDGLRLIRELRIVARLYLEAQAEIATLNAKLDKMRSDASWAESARHAERSGGTL